MVTQEQLVYAEAKRRNTNYMINVARKYRVSLRSPTFDQGTVAIVRGEHTIELSTVYGDVIEMLSEISHADFLSLPSALQLRIDDAIQQHASRQKI